MSKLIVCNQDGAVEGEYILNKERFSIGRKSHNDIALHHAVVSSEHALIITIRNDSFLEDLDSTNGVRVNNVPVKKCVLQDGDELKIGRFLITYVYEELPQVQDEQNNLEWLMGSDTVLLNRQVLKNETPVEVDLAATQKIRDEPEPALVLSAEQEAAPVPVSRVKAVVRMLTGPGAGKELGLEKMLTTIGKPGLQVAVITRRSKGYFLTHIEGGDFPLVNGSPVGPHSHALKNHDIIELANIRMEFFL